MLADVLTIKGILERGARWYPDRPAVTDDVRTVRYAELDRECRAVAQAFAALGLVKGDRVAFLCNSTVDLVRAYHAAHKLGLVTATLHGREAPAQHVTTIAKIGARLLVHDDDQRDVAAAIASAVPGLRVVPIGPVSIDASLAALAEGQKPDDAGVDVTETDPATILLSSGTTGLPKALLHTHRDVLASADGLALSWSGILPDDVFLSPFSPSFAVWLGHPTAFLDHGAHVVLMARWNPEDFLRLIARHRVTCTALTPTMWKGVLRLDVEACDLSSLRLAYYVGERMARERIEEVMRRITPAFGSLYGMAEFIGGTGFTMIRAHELRAGKWTSIGKPMHGTDLRIVHPGDDPHDQVPDGEVGEIVMRGATLAETSLTDPAWKSRRVRDGWLFTRDLAWRDAEGYVHLVGRADSMINSGGVKFTPEDVEAALEQHPDVAEAAVLGVTDPEWGQRVVAFIVARRPLGADELDRWCREHQALASFKRPREYRFVDRLPRSATGKLDRRGLRDIEP